MTSPNVKLKAWSDKSVSLPSAGKMRSSIQYLLLLFYTMFLLGCGVYSFTGASIPPDAKTISITYFVNNAQYVEPSLSQSLTDALRDRFQSQTDLDFVKEEGDLQIEGNITDYSTRPVAIQGNETAAMNRLSVTVKVKFTNTLDPSKDFDMPFTRFYDYSSSQDLSVVKDQLISEIDEMLVEDIFNKAVVNW
jgi:outer membrane lipopolysaccharide assembly protein LptE/RlpB